MTSTNNPPTSPEDDITTKGADTRDGGQPSIPTKENSTRGGPAIATKDSNTLGVTLPPPSISPKENSTLGAKAGLTRG